MKLITKISLTYFFITSLIFIAGGIASHFVIMHEVDEKIDLRLHDEKMAIRRIARLSQLAEYKQALGDQMKIVAMASSGNFREEVKDTLIVHRPWPHRIPYRQLSFVHTIGGKSYRIILRKAMVESRDLIDGILPGLAIVAVTLLLVLIATNYIVSKRIWRPFYQTIDEINRYDLAGNQALQFSPVHIKEFDMLNLALNTMSSKIQRDYLSLKEFSENASHEMQTPLSVIRSKTELLMQSEGLGEEQFRHLRSIDQASARLARLHQSLLLLMKIENRQFDPGEKYDLKPMIESHIKEIEELAELKQASIERRIEASKFVVMNPILAEALLKNLLMNAVKYCNEKGSIKIFLSQSELTIANTGAPLKLSPEQLFERFKKDHQSSDSLGLGLSIVKGICELYGFHVQYAYHDNYHTFTVTTQTSRNHEGC